MFQWRPNVQISGSGLAMVCWLIPPENIPFLLRMAGIAVGIGMIIWPALGWLESKLSSLFNWHRALTSVILLVCALTISSGFFFLYKQLNPVSNAQVKVNSTTFIPQITKSKRTLRDLFNSDFPITVKTQNDREITMRGTNIVVSLTIQRAYDFNAGTVFLAFYVPSSNISLDIYKFIADIYDQALKDDPINVETKTPGDVKTMKSKDFRFAGMIYLYGEKDMDIQEKADLDKYYSSKNLVLQFRSYDYEFLMNK